MTSNNGSGATAGQIGYIKGLQKRGAVQQEVDFRALSKYEASEIITVAETQQAAESNPSAAGAQKKTERRFDPVRFGLCVKLVWQKKEYSMHNSVGVQLFRADVMQFYDIVAEIEKDMSGN